MHGDTVTYSPVPTLRIRVELSLIRNCVVRFILCSWFLVVDTYYIRDGHPPLPQRWSVIPQSASTAAGVRFGLRSPVSKQSARPSAVGSFSDENCKPSASVSPSLLPPQIRISELILLEFTARLKDQIHRRPEPAEVWRECHEGGEGETGGMARGAIEYGRGCGKFCCSFKRITFVVCCVNLVAALLVLRSFYASFLVSSSRFNSDGHSGTKMSSWLIKQFRGLKSRSNFGILLHF